MFFVFAVFVFVSYGFRRWQRGRKTGLMKKMFHFSELSIVICISLLLVSIVINAFRLPRSSYNRKKFVVAIVQKDPHASNISIYAAIIYFPFCD
jgi:hypothetical protein